MYENVFNCHTDSGVLLAFSDWEPSILNTQQFDGQSHRNNCPTPNVSCASI